jgi:hypothetical protein
MRGLRPSMRCSQVPSRAPFRQAQRRAITSDAGGLLLGSTDHAIGLVDRFAGCLRDGRAPGLIETSVRTPIVQRVFAVALGYEDSCAVF